MDNIYFRERLYKYLKEKVAANLTENDLDIIIKLMCYIFGDLDYQVYRIPWYVDVDRCPEDKLKLLASNIGFPWNVALEPNKQREYMKLYIQIRRRRGTKWAIENLCKVFGQDPNSYYSSADLRGVELLEYPGDSKRSGGPKYPGDMVLRVPELTTIMYNEVVNTKLAGTRLLFLFYLFIGTFHMNFDFSTAHKVKVYFDPEKYLDYRRIYNWGPEFLETPIEEIKDWLIQPYVESMEVNGSVMVNVFNCEPWHDDWILNKPGLPNYRGRVIDDRTIVDEERLYSENNTVAKPRGGGSMNEW